MKKKLIAFIFIIFLLGLAPAVFVSASDPLGFDQAANLGLQNSDIRDPRVIIVNIVKYLLTFIGLIAVAMIIYSGFLWMTSEGDPSKVTRAKQTLVNAAIGLAIILSAFMIVLFVENLINNGGAGGGGGGGGGGNALGGGLGANGNRVIETHYPGRGQTDVPRNTRIAITFREAVDPASLISGGQINQNNVLVGLASQIGTGPFLANFNVTATADNRTFVFTQYGDFFGSPSENLWYAVRLRNILRQNGSPIFAIGQYYEWQFEVGTEMDLTPPQVRSVVPRPGASEPRNAVIQATFSEGIDPVSGSGQAPAFSHVAVRSASANLAGFFYISNAYRTIEFLTDEECGTNSCNETVYCLPASADIGVRINAASLANSLGGIIDMAGNSLDGNGNGTAQGPEAESALAPYNANSPDAAVQGDDFIWNFETTNEIDISAPNITALSPDLGANNVSTEARPRITFDKRLMASSINKSSVWLYADPAGMEVNFWLGLENSDIASEGRIEISHDEFALGTSYIPECNSGVRDIYQNCFRPGGTGGGGQGPAAGAGLCTPAPYCCDGTASADSCGN